MLRLPLSLTYICTFAEPYIFAALRSANHESGNLEGCGYTRRLAHAHSCTKHFVPESKSKVGPKLFTRPARVDRNVVEGVLIAHTALYNQVHIKNYTLRTILRAPKWSCLNQIS